MAKRPSRLDRLAVSLGLMVLFHGCGEWPPPADPVDCAAEAQVRIYVEVDFQDGWGGYWSGGVDAFAQQLVGDQTVDPCGPVFDYGDPDAARCVDLKKEDARKLGWEKDKTLLELVGKSEYQDEDALATAYFDLIRAEKQQWSKRPNVHLVVAGFLIDRYTQSEDPERPGQPWRYDDDKLPKGADIFGITYAFEICVFPSEGRFPEPRPTSVVFLGHAEKWVTEMNQILSRPAPDEGCGFQSEELFDMQTMFNRVIVHELMHQLHIENPHRETLPDFEPYVYCHDDLASDYYLPNCRCVMSWISTDAVRGSADLTGLLYADCDFAKELVERMQWFCVGESGNSYHYLDHPCSWQLLQTPPDL